jgi:hypothetical protein
MITDLRTHVLGTGRTVRTQDSGVEVQENGHDGGSEREEACGSGACVKCRLPGSTACPGSKPLLVFWWMIELRGGSFPSTVGFPQARRASLYFMCTQNPHLGTVASA